MIVIGLHWFVLLSNWYLAMAYAKMMDGHWRQCGCASFDMYDRIAILFCGAQKTAAMGIPIIETMFGNDSNIGMYIIPLLMYHPFQLIFDSLLVYPLSNWRTKQEAKKKILTVVETSINVTTLSSKHADG